MIRMLVNIGCWVNFFVGATVGLANIFYTDEVVDFTHTTPVPNGDARVQLIMMARQFGVLCLGLGLLNLLLVSRLTRGLSLVMAILHFSWFAVSGYALKTGLHLATRNPVSQMTTMEFFHLWQGSLFLLGVLFPPSTGLRWFDRTRTKVENAKEAVKDKVGDIKDTVRSKTSGITESARNKAGEITDAVRDKAGDLKDSVNRKAGDVKDSVNRKAGEAKESIRGKVDDAKATARGKYEEAKDSVRDSSHLQKGMSYADAVKHDLETEDSDDEGQEGSNSFTQYLRNGWSWLMRAGRNVEERTVDAGQRLIHSGRQARDDSDAEETTESYAERAKEKGRDIAHRAKQKGQNLAERARETGEEISEQIKEKGQGIAERAKQKGQNMAEQARETGEEITEQVKEKGQTLVDRAREKGQTIAEQAKQTGQTLIQRAKQTGENLAQQAKETGETIQEKASQGINQARAKLVGGRNETHEEESEPATEGRRSGRRGVHQERSEEEETNVHGRSSSRKNESRTEESMPKVERVDIVHKKEISGVPKIERADIIHNAGRQELSGS